MTSVSIQSERGIVVTIEPQAPRPILVQRPGVQGRGATVQIGTVTTVQPPNTASVTNSGTPVDAILDFEIPQGEAATVAVGTVTTVTPASPATVTNSGTTGAAVLDFEIPQGVPGVMQSIVPGSGVSVDGSDPINPEVSLDAASIASLALADTAVQPTRSVSAGTGLTGGGTLAANRTIALNSASIASLALADTALQTLTQGANITITGTGTTRTISASVPVSSVNAKTGAVVLSAADVGAATTAQGTKADNAVQFVSQSLTAAQQDQARDNVNALGGISLTANSAVITDASGGLSQTALTAFACSILDDADGAAMFATMGAAKTHGETGYAKAPDGTITQWGSSVVTTASEVNDIFFPVMFPTGCATVVVCNGDMTIQGETVFGVHAKYFDRFTLLTNGYSGVVRANWIAIGW